jgi:Mg2+ and Co2+ transporter CorA
MTRALKDTQTQLNMYKEQLILFSESHMHKILGADVSTKMIKLTVVSILFLIFTIIESQLAVND